MQAPKRDHPDRVIPFTPPGAAWSQREYLACAKLGIGFAAHRAGGRSLCTNFHYHFPGDAQCCTTVVVDTDVVRYVDHGFKPSSDWLDQCRAAMAGAGQ